MKQFLNARIDQVRQKLNALEADALLVFFEKNIRYLSNYSGEAAVAIISNDQNVLITDYRFIEQANKECLGFNTVCRDRKKVSLGEEINKQLKSLQVQTLAFESEHISVNQWQTIENALAVNTRATTNLVEELRQVKDEFEVNSMKLAATIADNALAQLLPLFKSGVTEKDMALELEYQMLKAGSEGVSFPTIMLFGARSSLPHGIPGQTQLTSGDIILIDFGAVVNGYRSDMTRSYLFQSDDEKQKRIYQAVALAQQSAIETLKAGIGIDAVNQSSQKVLQQSGYGEFSGEGLGHGVGLVLHERPFIGMDPDTPLSKGQVVTIEPGIYIPDWGGIRLEDDFLITENGYEQLTHAPKPMELG